MNYNDLLFNNKVFTSLLLLILIAIIKWLLYRFVRRRYKQKGVDKRHLVNTVKNLINLMLLISLMALWMPELQKFALSIAAFVVAIVLATKEIIQCFIGFIYISSSRPFRIGDWIQINDHIGEVSETDWAKVTLLEIDIASYSYSGRSVFLPNSLLMSQPIKNLNYMKRYVNHSFSIVREDKIKLPENLKEELLARAIDYCANFKDVAERYNALITNRLDVSIPGPEPSVKISTTDIGKIKVTFDLFCPTNRAIRIEEKLTDDLFKLWKR